MTYALPSPSLEVWWAIGGITLATVIARSSLLVLSERIEWPKRLDAALRFAPACALAAIAVPDLVVSSAGLDLGWTNPRWMAGIAGVIIFAFFRSTVGTIAGGMMVFWLLRALGPGG